MEWIYVTGDIHGEFSRFYKNNLRAKEIEFGEQDYVI